METLVILAVWIAIVVGVAAAVTRPWTSRAARAPLPVGLGLAGASWVVVTGFMSYRQMMGDGAWTGATIAMAFVPAKAIFISLLAYAAGRTALTARTHETSLRRWAGPALLAAAVLYFVASDVIAMRGAALERHAANPALTDAERMAFIARLRAGNAARGEISAFLGNPRCPPELLAEYAANPDVYWRTAVARNDLIDATIADKLAADPEEQVRYYLAFNRKLPAPTLRRLVADSSENVRDIVAWTAALTDDDFDRLVNDPSPKVRATAALQARLSDAQRAKLLNDPEQRVRDAANRWR